MPQDFFGVHLSMRALQSVLGSAALARSTVACICTGYCIVLYVYLGGRKDRVGKPGGGAGVLNVGQATSDLRAVHYRGHRRRRMTLAAHRACSCITRPFRPLAGCSDTLWSPPRSCHSPVISGRAYFYTSTAPRTGPFCVKPVTAQHRGRDQWGFDMCADIKIPTRLTLRKLHLSNLAW